MSDHAILAPSSCERWSNCTASARMEAKYPNESSWAANQGTAAHSMGEKKLKEMLHLECDRVPTEFDDSVMDEMTDIYRDVCVGQLVEASKIDPNPTALIEYQVDLTRVVPEGFGTADFLIVTNEKIWVTDFKYGRAIVSVVDNPQLKLYGFGAYYNFSDRYPDVKSVCLTIVQPRADYIESYEVPLAELREWAENRIAPLAQIAFEGGPEATQVPGRWCRYCRAKPDCLTAPEEGLFWGTVE